jgi:hypothetical protein
MLLWVCEDDALAPPDGAIAKVARESQNAQVKRHPGGHFDIYVNGPFERAVEDQIAFLTQTLAAQKTAAQ